MNKIKKSPIQDAEKAMLNTVAGQIWNEIKDKRLDMFALPDQRVHHYCHPRFVEPSKLYLMVTATSTLPCLEAALGNEYVVELMDKYVMVARAEVPLTKK